MGRNWSRIGMGKGVAVFASGLAAAMLWVGRAAAGDVESREIHTEHYDLYIEGPGADELAGLVEPLYARLKEFFGKEPHERLKVKVFANKDSFVDETYRDHIGPNKRSFYSPASHMSYVLRDGGERGTILHECVHQFHFLACTGNRRPQSWFYIEGLPMHFATCRWTGERVILEAVPQIDDTDVGALALEDFLGTHARSFERLARDDHQDDMAVDYSGGWGLVSFLYAKHRDVFEKWSAALDQGATPEAAWDGASGALEAAKLNDEYEQWLRDVEAPWHGASGHWWSPNLKLIQGQAEADASATAYLKKPVESLSISVHGESKEEKVSAGLVVGRVGDDTYHLVEVLADGQVRVRTQIRRRWVVDFLVENVRVKDPKEFTIAVRRAGNVASVVIDDGAVTELPVGVESRSGVVVSNGTATFSQNVQ